MRFVRSLLLTISAILLSAFQLAAAPVKNIFQANIVGLLYGDHISGTLTLTATIDTANVTSNGSTFWNDAITSVLELAGVGSFTITNASYVFDSQNSSKVGFGVKGLPLCCDTIQHLEAPYATYDLQSSIGPIATSENLSIADWLDVPTTAGLFTITQMTDNTFQ